MTDQRAARGTGPLARGFGPAQPAGRLRCARRLRALTLSTALTASLAVTSAAWAAGGVGLGVTGSTTASHRSDRSHASGSHGRSTNPLHGRAMWIWELPFTDRGDLARIIAGARYYRITALIIKSSDGTAAWSQFTPALVSALHAAHLKVCAWQYIYGNHPGVEANLGADAVKDGADCLVIDAESEYEGRYVAAQAYVRDLRKQIGARYPVALAGFPYVDYHPGFPYSVFLGPGGAQYDMPQMYWRDIGTSPAGVFAHTYAFNLPYGRPIYPLGQLYGNPPARQIEQFRRLAMQYGAGGVSWWDWQEARAPAWNAVSAVPASLPHAAVGAAEPPAMATVGLHARGDLVVWIQEHLVSAGEADTIDGDFGSSTEAAVEAFQTAHGLVADGLVGPETWAALLRYRPAAVTWVRHGRQTIATTADSIGRAIRVAGGAAPLRLPVPASAGRPVRRNEIPGHLGAGR